VDDSVNCHITSSKETQLITYKIRVMDDFDYGCNLSPLPNFGNHMTREEFDEYLREGWLTSSDGKGFLATKDSISPLRVPLDLEEYRSTNSGFTHVLWYDN
jgi:hypothetical protein